MKALFDTNILIDYLNGESQAHEELQRYHQRLISLITWIEVLVGCQDAEEERIVRRFLAGFELVAVDLEIGKRAVELRRLHRIRLPDVLIWASAQHHNALLVSRNSRDFPPDTPGIRLPYQL